MTDKEKLDMAIEHIEATVGGLSFAFACKRPRSDEAKQKRESLIEALAFAAKVLEKTRREA
jgi:hypothetical protein